MMLCSFKYMNSLKWWKLVISFVTPFALLPLILCIGTQVAKCGYVVLVMAIFWMLELLPLGATALIPVVCFPLLGIMNSGDVTPNYMKDVIMTFLGSMTFAVAIEHCNLHKRIALRVLLFVGTGFKWLLLGFMLTTMFLSMWILNTAATAMMLPIADTVIEELKKSRDRETAEGPVLEMETLDKGKKTDAEANDSADSSKANNKEADYLVTNAQINNGSVKIRIERGESSTPIDFAKLRKVLLLGIAYSSNCGGTGTLTGTSPNLFLKEIVEDQFPDMKELTYATWILYNVPGMILTVFTAWLFLQLAFEVVRSKESNDMSSARAVIKQQYRNLGPISFQEMAVLVLFILLVLSWFFRDPIFIPGWANVVTSQVKIRDSAPAIFFTLLLFLIPADPENFRKSPPLIDWKTAQNKLPWWLLLFVGGGIALAEGAKRSGFSDWVGLQLSVIEDLPLPAILVILCILTASITELVNDAATASMILPVVSILAKKLKVHPLYLMLPTAVASSFSFMLPVATGPNALVSQATGMGSWEMAKPGFFMNIICCGIEMLMINTLGPVIFDFEGYSARMSANNTLSIDFDSAL